MRKELYLGRKIYLVLTFSFLFSNTIFAQIDGEELYKTNCTACHVMTDKRLVGPGLKGVTDKYSKDWLKKWIINSQEFIASGDEKAIAIYEEYNKQIMPAFYFLIKQISTYHYSNINLDNIIHIVNTKK